MKKNIVVFFFFSLFSCQSMDLIDRNNITKIILVDKEKQVVINDKDSISTIIKKINSAIYDPSVFYPEYEIDVCYGDSIKAVLCNSNRIKIDGRSYKLSKPLKAYFKH